MDGIRSTSVALAVRAVVAAAAAWREHGVTASSRAIAAERKAGAMAATLHTQIGQQLAALGSMASKLMPRAGAVV